MFFLYLNNNCNFIEFQSNQEEDDDDMHESDFSDEDDGVSHLNRRRFIKLEDIGHQASDVLAPMSQEELEERDQIERELKIATQARSQRELVEAIQRHVVAMNAVAANATAHFPGMVASAASSNVGSLPLNTVTSSATATGAAATSTLVSSSSPSGASGSSGPSSSSAIQSIEAAKGYTFEEQFKQVILTDLYV